MAICCSQFFQLLIFTALMTTLPVYVKDVLRGSDEQAGLALAIFLLGAVISRPLGGKWLSRYDNRRVLLASLALFLATTVLYMGIGSLNGLLVLRFLHGLGFGVVNTAGTAIAARIIPEHRKGEGMGYFTTSVSLAMVVGPLCGLSIIAAYDFGLLFAVCVAFGVLAFVCGSVVRVPWLAGAGGAAGEERAGWEHYFEPAVIPVAIAGSLLSLVFGGIVTFVPIYAKELGFPEYARYFFLAYAVVMVFSRPLAGRVFDRLGVNVVFYPTIVFYVLGLVVLSRIDAPLPLVAAGVFIGLGYGTLFSIVQTVALQLVPGHRQGVATGTYFLFWDCGTGLGAFVLGVAASFLGYGSMYLVATVFVLVSASLFFWVSAGRGAAARPEKRLAAELAPVPGGEQGQKGQG